MKFRAISRKKEKGAVAVTFALLLFLLLGFAGIALDFGHLLVVRTELQTAMDSCALAAAQEMDGQADALTRARSAGKTAANANAVDMQSVDWSGKGLVTDADFEFLNAGYAPTAVSADVRYVRCKHTQTATNTPLISILGAFTGVSAYAGTMDVAAQAMATLTPAQSACPLPMTMQPKTSVKPDYGFEKGKWYDLLNPGESLGPGQIGWANLDGSNSASETALELKGRCGTHVGDTLGTPGFQNSMIDLWNTRFGIYKSNSGPDKDPPDFTGFAYTGTSWTKGANALSDFLQKRQTFTPCADSVANCEKASGLSLNQFQTVSQSADLRNSGTNRRLATVPITSAGKVVDFACMLLLQPIPSPFNKKDVVKLEYVGNASVLGSPCTGSGLPGGSAGPLVPVLVR